MSFTRRTIPAQHYIYVDRNCPYGPEIADAMGSAFAEVFGFVATEGLKPLSMPMSVYTEMDPTELRFRGGVAVSAEDAAKATGNIKSDVLPTDVVTGLHTGAYDNMNKTHQALWSHMEAENLPAAMPVWEVYIDDPGDTAPAKLRTEIYRAVGDA